MGLPVAHISAQQTQILEQKNIPITRGRGDFTLTVTQTSAGRKCELSGGVIISNSIPAKSTVQIATIPEAYRHSEGTVVGVGVSQFSAVYVTLSNTGQLNVMSGTGVNSSLYIAPIIWYLPD